MFGKSRKEEELSNLLQRAERNRFMAEGRYLECLRRELALWLLRENPNALVDAYRKAKAFDNEMRTAPESRRLIERAAISEKFPFFGDFDVVCLKHFVPFEGDIELEIVLRYLDITKMLTLLSIEDRSYNIVPFSDLDEKVLFRVIQETHDQALRKHVDIAMGRYYAFGQERNANRTDSFSDRDYTVFGLQHFAEVRYGIHVKNENRYAIYSTFYGDDKSYVSYYEADERFEEKHSLRK